ncbi:MAG: signal peptidase I [Minisyncoccia bacterium]
MQSSSGGWLKDLFTLAILILVVVVPLRLFVISPFVVDGESMHPTFENLDYLIIDEITYRFEAPQRGDVIVFRYPLNTSIFYIKRIIGLPGETVSISHGVVSITEPSGSSFSLSEPYISAEDASYDEKVTLGTGEYFVMGDNRPNSSDSRVWGPVPRSDIVGRVLIRLLPLSKIGLFPGEARYLVSATSSNPIQPQAP